jgi:RNA polymerase sigma factor (sigma-70 family)
MIFENDRPLLDAFRRGQKAALSRVYFAYVDEVARVVRDRELIQEVFVRAFSESARLAYDGLRPYRPYLLRIARNVLVDRLRARGREVDVDTLELADEKPSADELLHTARMKEATAEHVARLSAEEKRFIRLRYEEGLSQEDVAKQMKATRRRMRTLEKRIEEGLVAHLRKRGLIE